MTVRVNSWSGPRNLSTALMRSFGNRSDTRAVDEPLYGPYLASTGAPHPGRAELLEELETDPRTIIDDVILGPCDRPVLFMKQMVHHLTTGLNLGFLDHCVNVFLIRDPAEVISSLVNQLPEPTMRDVGLERQVILFRDLRDRGQEPPVIDARELLLDPEHVLGALCDRIGLPWGPGDAGVACGPTSGGRSVGALLVRQRQALDRVRAVPAEEHGGPRREWRAARRMPRLLRRAERGRDPRPPAAGGRRSPAGRPVMPPGGYEPQELPDSRNGAAS